MTDSRSWNLPKTPFSSEISEVLPTVAIFEPVLERIRALEARLLGATGAATSDALPAELVALAAAYESIGRISDARNALDVAATLASCNDEVDIVGWTLWQARLCSRAGSRDEAFELLRVGLESTGRSDDPAGVGELMTYLALIDLMRGDTSSAVLRLDTSFSIARQLQSVPMKAAALSAVVVAHVLDGHHAEAHDVFSRAVLLHQRNSDLPSLSKLYNNIGVMLHRVGAHTEAIPFIEAGLEFATTAPDLLNVLALLNNNVRVFEDRYLVGAREFRGAFVSCLALLADPDTDRFGDLTMLPSCERLTPPGATYRSDPHIVESLLLLPTRRTRPFAYEPSDPNSRDPCDTATHSIGMSV